VLELLEDGKTSEELQRDLCTRYGLDLGVVQQYYLIHTTVMAYLSHLHESGMVEITLRGNSLHWRRVS
jgi:hypothetical protein